MVRKLIICIFGLMMGMMLLACAPKIIPVANGVSLVDTREREIVKDVENFTISVKSSAWKGSPTYLDEYLTTFLVSVKNKCNAPVNLDYNKLILLDDKGNQFGVISPERASRTIWDSYYHSSYFSFGIMAGTGGRDVDFWGGYDFRFPRRDYYEYHNDVIRLAFPPDNIQPQAQVKGFIYFQKFYKESSRLKLTLSLHSRDKDEKFEFEFLIHRS